MEVQVVDVGIACDLDTPGLIRDKSMRGTSNFTAGPAMSMEQMDFALQAGMRAVDRAGDVQAIAVGELGIGNTTTAAAIVSAFSGSDPQKTCGKGTGLDADGVARKVTIVRRALEANQVALDAYKKILAQAGQDPQELKRQALHVLAALGGLELAAIVGAIFRAREKKIAVLVDGFISSAAALAAVHADPDVSEAIFLATRSAEVGHEIAIEALRARSTHTPPPPVLDMQLALGEGTGAVLAYPILRGAADIVREMISLEDAMKL
mmetsp:Transcript_43907/g.138594  ORF Transcript_43907/g.138594 Transcript_43907/m.138594 type:complete len:265 (-) Transcript_43907:90-884(-)